MVGEDPFCSEISSKAVLHQEEGKQELASKNIKKKEYEENANVLHINNISHNKTLKENELKDFYENRKAKIPLTVDDLKINSGEDAFLKREEFMKTFINNVFENNNALFLYCKYVLLVYGKKLIEERNVDLLNFEIVKGGITNILVKLHDKTKKNKYLIRLYGPKTSEIINREREKKIADILFEANISKKIYVFFPNGRIEEFMDGSALTKEDIKKDIFQKKIAEKLKMLHDITINDDLFEQLKILQHMQVESKEQNEEETKTLNDKDIDTKTKVKTKKEKRKEEIQRVSFLWPMIWKYFNILYSHKNEAHSFNSKLNILNLIDFEKLRKTIQEVEHMCVSKKSPVVLCHCDLLSSNIIVKDDETISFIDFEYSCPVERAYDIANHFNEYAGFNCDWNHLPTKAEEYNFIKYYLKTEDEHLINSLISELQPFYLSSHIYWGLWGLLQAMHSSINFDFVSYAMKRLTALYSPIFTEKLN